MSNTAQRSFAKGEIAPALYARSDQVAYVSGLRTCRNFIVRRTGGIDNRPGTELVGIAPNTIVRLIPFEFNDTAGQSYVLEFTGSLVRFIRNGAVVAFSLSVPYAASDLAAIQFTQTADVLTLVHPSYPPAELRRLAETNWTYTVINVQPGIQPPTGVTTIPAPIVGTYRSWVVTAVDATTGQESVASLPVSTALAPPTVMPHVVIWNAVANAASYNVYQGGTKDGSVPLDYGFVGSTGTALAFYDLGATPDYQNRPTLARNPFASAGQYPSATNYYQGRRVFGGANLTPQTVYASRSGDYANFTVSSPSQDDDALTFGLVSKKVNTIRHVVDTGNELVVLTSGGEWVINGDSAGVLRPTDINARQFSRHGCSTLSPIQIERRVLYVHARRAVVRDLFNVPYQGFHGSDLTIFSQHLFDGHAIVDWAYQEVPNSIVWCVRDDGVLLGLTDVAEQEVQGWHRHDTLGTVTACCVVPEGTEDRLYLAVARNGQTLIERMASRFISDIVDAIFTDSTLTYDGRNTTSATMLLSGGTTWDYDELLTCICSVNEFSVSDIGNAVAFTDDDGSPLLFTIAGYTSPTVVTGFASRTVPAEIRTPVTDWARAVDQVTGLGHLEGLAVSITADGYVVANPNNPQIPVVRTVSGGSVTLDRPYSVIHVGLAYVSDAQTLDIDSPQGASLKERTMKIDRVTAVVAASRGIFAGSGEPASDSVTDPLFEWKLRDTEDYNQPVSLRTGTIRQNITNSWSYEGRLFVRQVDPMPCSILALIPTGAQV